jgi:hypothetical protein
VPLSPALVGRLALAGGLCSAVTCAITSPIDLRKTRAQAATGARAVPAAAPAPVAGAATDGAATAGGATAAAAVSPPTPPAGAEGGKDATAPPRPTTRPGGAEEGGEDAAAPPRPTTTTFGSGGAEDGEEEEAMGEEEPQPPSNWLGIDASIAAGFAMGAGSFGTYEVLRWLLRSLRSSPLGCCWVSSDLAGGWLGLQLGSGLRGPL